MKRSSTTKEASAEEIVENLRSLIEEAQTVISAGGEKSGEVLSDLREQIEEGIERLNIYYRDTKEKIVDGAKRTDATIRRHPYESLAVALGIGVVIGALVRGRK